MKTSTSENYGLPFEKFQKVSIQIASNFSRLSESETQAAKELQKLIEEHRHGIEIELGCPFEFVSAEHNVIGARWLIGPSCAHPEILKLQNPSPQGPTIYLDRKKGLLVTDGRTADETMETFSWLRSLRRFEDGYHEIKNCNTITEAISRIQSEVAFSFPAFELHNIQWDKICDHHIPLIQKEKDPIPAMQKWLAELGDAHTWIRPIANYGHFPYDLWIENNRVFFYRISEQSRAWEMGIRPGDELLEENVQEWWDRTSASPHGKPFVTGARMLATPLNSKRGFIALTAQGKKREWEEQPTTNRWSPVLKTKTLKSGTAYLRVEAWLTNQNLEEDLDEAFQEFQNYPKLIVDLRANPGGSLLMAHRFRNRFLKQSGPVGWMQATLPNGKLGSREQILGETVEQKNRWNKPVIFLTDPLTYSASEDAILGLQGLDHVKVIGQASGGGSGRVRLLKLLEGWRLTVSTALTFDLQGRCIEGSGIPVDHEFPFSFNPEDLIQTADQFF